MVVWQCGSAANSAAVQSTAVHTKKKIYIVKVGFFLAFFRGWGRTEGEGTVGGQGRCCGFPNRKLDIFRPRFYFLH